MKYFLYFSICMVSASCIVASGKIPAGFTYSSSQTSSIMQANKDFIERDVLPHQELEEYAAINRPLVQMNPDFTRQALFSQLRHLFVYVVNAAYEHKHSSGNCKN
jgi:hypothetical protein